MEQVLGVVPLVHLSYIVQSLLLVSVVEPLVLALRDLLRGVVHGEAVDVDVVR